MIHSDESEAERCQLNKKKEASKRPQSTEILDFLKKMMESDSSAANELDSLESTRNYGVMAMIHMLRKDKPA